MDAGDSLRLRLRLRFCTGKESGVCCAGCAVPGCVSTLCSAHPSSPVDASCFFVSLLVQFPLAHSRCPAAHLPASQRCPGQPLPSWCCRSSPAASQPRANILQVVNCSQGPEGHPACLLQMGGSDRVLKGRKLFQTTEVVVMSLAMQGKFKKKLQLKVVSKLSHFDVTPRSSLLCWL